MTGEAKFLWLVVGAAAIYWWFFEKHHDGVPTKDRVSTGGRVTTEKTTQTYQFGDYKPLTYLDKSDPGTPSGIEDMFNASNSQYSSGVLSVGVTSAVDPSNPNNTRPDDWPLSEIGTYQQEPLSNGVASNTSPGVNGFTS